MEILTNLNFQLGKQPRPHTHFILRSFETAVVCFGVNARLPVSRD